MKILALTSTNEPTDGWSSVGYNILKNLNECEIEIFSSEKKNKLGFGHNKLKSEMFNKFNIFVIIYDVINVLISSKKKPNIIYCNVEYYAPVAMILSKIYRIPYTVTAHGTYGVILPLKYAIYKWAYKYANKLITVSDFTKKRMIEEKIHANYEIIYNGVDTNIFIPNIEIKKENIITFVGNLKARKGLSFLLESMVTVNKVKPDIKVVIIGKIDFQSVKYFEVLKYIKDNALNVEFSGKVESSILVEYYQKSKLNVLPSMSSAFYFEGFGLIHLEANACGTLTIGTKNSGNESAIKNNGFLVTYGDIEELSNIILDVFSLDNKTKVDINVLTSWFEVSKKYLKVFESLT